MRVRVTNNNHSSVEGAQPHDSLHVTSPRNHAAGGTSRAAPQQPTSVQAPGKQPGSRLTSPRGAASAFAAAAMEGPADAAALLSQAMASKQQQPPSQEPRPRGCTRKQPEAANAPDDAPPANGSNARSESAGNQQQQQPPRKRGRPRKPPLLAPADSQEDSGICDTPGRQRQRQRAERTAQHANGQEVQQQQPTRKSIRERRPKGRPLSPDGPQPRKRISRKPAASGATDATSQQQQQQHRDDVYRRAVRRAANYIHRIKAEEHAIQTYAADGWRGASREKVRLTDELQQAQQRMARYQAAIQDAVKTCDEAQGDTAIPADAFDSEGELDEKHIFCARCHGRDSPDDNDIILCDGPCNRAYHECCLSPRVVAAELPEDEGWLCPACDAKADIMHELNDVFGTKYGIETSWHDLFNAEQEALRLRRLCSDPLSPRAGAGGLASPAVAAAAVAGGGKGGGTMAALLGADLPSDDDSDASFSEEEGGSAAGVQQQRSSYSSEGAGTSNSNSSGTDNSEQGGQEASSEGLSEAVSPRQHPSKGQQRGFKRARPLSGAGVRDAAGQRAGMCGGSPQPSGQGGGGDLQPGKRRRARVDYLALHEQMFGGLDPATDEPDDEDYSHEA